MSQHTLSDYVASTVKEYLSICNGHVSQPLYAYVMEHTEKLLIKEVLQHTDYNQSKAANILGISRVTLKKKLIKHDIHEN